MKLQAPNRTAPEADAQAWTAELNNHIAEAKQKDGRVDIPKLVESTRDLFGRLDQFPAATRSALFLQPLVEGLGFDATMTLLATRRGQSVGEVKSNPLAALAELARAPATGAQALERIKLKPLNLGAPGQVSMFIGRMEELHGIDVAIIPAHTTADPQLGGSGRGGVEKAYFNRAEDLGSEAAMTAVAEYERQRGHQNLVPGTTLPVATGLDTSAFPSVLEFVASVPPSGLRVNDLNAKDPALKELRTAHLKNVLIAALEDTTIRAAGLLGKKPTAEDPVVVALPLLCTGPQGSVTVTEAAEVYRSVLKDWAPANPGLKLIIARANIYGDQSDRFAQETRQAIKVVEGGKADRAAAPLSVPQLFAQLIGDHAKPTGRGGVALTPNYVGAALDTWVDQASKTLKEAGPIGMRDPYATAASFRDRTAMEASYQIHRLLDIPELAQAHGIKAGGMSVGNLQALLGHEDLRQRVLDKILAHPKLQEVVSDDGDPKRLFGGDAKMQEILGAAVAAVLYDLRHDHLDQFRTNFAEAMATVEAKLVAAQAKLAESVPKEQVDVLIQDMAKAITKGDQATIRRLEGDNQNLRAELNALKAALTEQKKERTAYRDRAEAKQTSTSYASVSGSEGWSSTG